MTDEPVTVPEDDDPEPCVYGLEASYEDDHWVIDRCGKPAVFGTDLCTDHLDTAL